MSGLNAASAASNGEWKIDAAHGVKWMFNCDWPGNVFHSPRMSSEECGPACARKPACTHFTHRDGVCYMKSMLKDPYTARDPALNMPNRVCGTQLWYFDDHWQFKWMFNCDFHGYTYKSAIIGGHRCGILCTFDPYCTHFVYRDGTCWMKAYPGGLERQPDLNQEATFCGQIYYYRAIGKGVPPWCPAPGCA
jgi:hypothetical protein